MSELGSPSDRTASAFPEFERVEWIRALGSLAMTVRTRTSVAALVLTLAGGVAGCSHPRCAVPPTEVGALCPQTFDVKMAEPIRCPDPTADLAIADCPDRPLVLEILSASDAAYPYRACFYDRTSHRLVGIHVSSGLPIYCGNTSYTEDYGEIVLGLCDPQTSTHVSVSCVPP